MSGKTVIPIYTTAGDVAAYLAYPYLINRMGEWIGFVTRERDVHAVDGRYVGFLANGPRILRKRNDYFEKPPHPPPPPPGRLLIPAIAPLPPLMPELSFAEIDVLEDEPQRLSTQDAGEYREDMD